MLKKLIYLEFLFPVKDYFLSVNLREGIFDWVVPLFVSSVLYFVVIKNLSMQIILSIAGYYINVLAILIGFSITCLTVLTTSNNENIKDLREQRIERKIDGIKISLYRLILITFSFALCIELLSLLLNILYCLIYSTKNIRNYSKAFFSFNLMLLLAVIAINIRNIVNFYFIHFRKEDLN